MSHPQQVWSTNVTDLLGLYLTRFTRHGQELTPNGTWQDLKDIVVVYTSVT